MRYDSNYAKPVFLAVKCTDSRWHFMLNYVIRNGRIIGTNAFKPDRVTIASLKSGRLRLAKYNKRLDTFKLF